MTEKVYKKGGMCEMLAISAPMVVSFACDTVMTFTDRLFLSKLGALQMSAAMSGGILFFSVMAFFFGLIGYVTALSAQYFGAGKKDKCSVVLTQGLVLVLMAYPLLLMLKPLLYKVLAAAGIDSAQFAFLKQYFNILIFGSLFVLSRYAFSSFFSGIGRTRYVMCASCLAMVINVFFNYCLIFGKFGLPALGIRGAAIGTICATLCACLFLLSIYLSKEIRVEFLVSKSFKFSKTIFLKLLHFGYPAGIESMFALGAFTGIVFLFHMQGAVAATASSILFNWDMVAFVPLLGVEIGVTSLVGRYVGAKEFDIVHKTVRSGVKMGLMYSVFIVVLFLLIPEQLVSIFKPNGGDEIFFQALPMAVSLVKCVPIYVFACTFLLVFSGALRGAGETFHAMLISVVLHWILLVVIAVSIYIFKMSVVSSWIALIVVFMMLFPAPYLLFRTGRWKRMHVID